MADAERAQIGWCFNFLGARASHDELDIWQGRGDRYQTGMILHRIDACDMHDKRFPVGHPKLGAHSPAHGGVRPETICVDSVGNTRKGPWSEANRPMGLEPGK